MTTELERHAPAVKRAPVQLPCIAPDFQMGEWHVQPSLGRLGCHGVEIRLRPQLMDVLSCLAMRAGRTVGRDEIFGTVWPGQFVAQTGLPRCIAEFRQVLHDDAREPTVIETIPKRGYRLLQPVAWAEDGGALEPTADAEFRCDQDVSSGEVQEQVAGLGDEAVSGRGDRGFESARSGAAAVPGGDGRWRWSTAWLTGSVALFTIAALGAVSVTTPTPVPAARDTVVVIFDNATDDSVFDDTLRLALAVQLEQSSDVRVVSEQRMPKTLPDMGRPRDAAITRSVARDLCTRTAATSLMSGSIVSLGSHYMLGLEAIACRTGESLAREQVEADGKESVMRALGRAVSHMRIRLGGSFASNSGFASRDYGVLP